MSQISELFDYATSLEPNKPYKEIDLGVIYHYKAQEINQKTGIRLNLAKKKLSSFDFDEVIYGGKNSKGKDSIVFIKKIRGLNYYVVMATSGEGEEANLYFNTMYIKR